MDCICIVTTKVTAGNGALIRRTRTPEAVNLLPYGSVLNSAWVKYSALRLFQLKIYFFKRLAADSQ